MNWYLYVLRCADGTLYTGVATDLERRVTEHNESPKGARYTRARRPVELVTAWIFEDRSAVCRAEYAFKQLSRKRKLAVIAGEAEPPELVALGKRAP